MVVCGLSKALVKMDHSTSISNTSNLIKLCFNSGFLTFSFVRNPNPNADELCIYEKPELKLPKDHYTPCPVKRGSLVVFDGLTIHPSDLNRSDRSRFAYTFHVMETDNVKFLPENWIRLPEGEQFERIY